MTTKRSPMAAETKARIDRETAAARVLMTHYPKADRRICHCGKEWHPLHQAKQLEAAGLLKETGR